MAHGILISDHDFLNDLIEVNLRAFLSCKLAVIKKLEKFKVLIEIDPTYDLIICMTTLENKDIVKAISHACNEYLPKAYVIFIGHHNENLSSRSHHSFRNHHDVMGLVRLCSELLKMEIDAAPKMTEADFFPIPLSLIAKLKKANQDYWKDNHDQQEFIKLAVSGEPIESKIKLWEQNKVTVIYVKKEDKHSAITLMTTDLQKELNGYANDPNPPSAEEVLNSQDSLLDKAGLVFSSIFKDGDSLAGLNFETKEALTSTAMATEKMISGLAKTLPQNLNKLILIFQNAKMSYVQRHTLLTSFLCLEMGRKESWFSTQVFATINLMVFFHDIVLTTIYIKYPHAPESEFDLLNIEGLSENEKNLIKWHPKVVSEMLGKLPGLPIGLDQLILQHHGTISGQIATTAPQEEIAPLSKLLYVAEKVAKVFLDSKIPLSEAERVQALSKIHTELVRKSYQKLLLPIYKLNL